MNGNLKSVLRNGSLGMADRRNIYPSGNKPDKYKKLALDEDNYLQPNSSKPRAYTDIIDGPGKFTHLYFFQFAFL